MRPAPLAALLLAACTPLAPSPDVPDEDDPVAPPPAAVVAPAPEAAEGSLPPGFEILGQPCPESAERSLQVRFECNAGRVASAYTVVSLPYPGPAQKRPDEKLPRMPRGTMEVEGFFQTTARVYLDDERLWVATVCVACRLPSEELRIVALSLAHDEDIASVQTSLGLPNRPVLRTAAAWREALARRRKAG